MANPKYKTSRSKTRRRRANIILDTPNIVTCPQCKEPRLPHRICTYCGTYDGKDIIKLEEAKAAKK